MSKQPRNRQVQKGLSFSDACGNREIVCPLLGCEGQYVGFNGSRKRRGCGYRLTSERGWLKKAGYDRGDVRDFLDDLAALVGLLRLTVVGLLPGTNCGDWLDLDRRQRLAAQPRLNTQLHRLQLRIYALADYLDRWNGVFGWPLTSLIAFMENDDTSDELSRILDECGLKQTEVATGLGIDPSRLSRYLSGKRKFPRDLPQSQPEPNRIYQPLIDLLNQSLGSLHWHAEDLAGTSQNGLAVVTVLDQSIEPFCVLREAELAYQNGAFDQFDAEIN